MNKEILKIAQTVLRLETLESQNSDSLDFQEHAVWMIKEALEQAYKKGQESARKGA